MADTGSGEDPRTSIAARTLSVISEASESRLAPAVTLSWAQSRDGAIAAAGGVRTPLSCPESLMLTHTLRAMHAAILVGIGTILADDPVLSVRLASGPQPQPVVLDSRLRFPLSARLLARTDRTPWIFHAAPDSGESRGFDLKIRELKARGAKLFAIGRTADGLDLEEVVSTLARQGVVSLMVEGGAHVLRSFLSRGLAHQVVITVCPFTLDGLHVLEQAAGPERLPDLVDDIRENHGRDTVVWGRVQST
jgi:riboflavin-specific deaminase-like protein